MKEMAIAPLARKVLLSSGFRTGLGGRFLDSTILPSLFYFYPFDYMAIRRPSEDLAGWAFLA
jgi:hypothetical protein